MQSDRVNGLKSMSAFFFVLLVFVNFWQFYSEVEAGEPGGNKNLKNSKNSLELDATKIIREPWSSSAPACKRNLMLSSSGLKPHMVQKAREEYEMEIRKGCIDITSFVIQEKVYPPVWMDKNKPAKVGLKKPIAVDYKIYSKKCNGILYKINEKMKPGGIQDISIDLSAYQKDCVAKFPDVSPGEDEDYFRSISIRTGILYYPTEKLIFCTAFQLSPRVVVTALHCLTNPQIDGALVGPSDITLRSFPDPEKDIKIVKFHYPVEEAQTRWFLQHKSHIGYVNDYALLELGSSLSMTADNIDTAGSLSDLHPNLVIPGFHSILAYPQGRTTSVARREEILRTWTAYLYWDNSGSCQREKLHGKQCLQHSCSTVKGFSGSPIFGFNTSSRKVVFLGVHSGSFGKVSCVYPPEDSSDDYILDLGAPNLGTILDDEWLDNRLNEIAAR